MCSGARRGGADDGACGGWYAVGVARSLNVSSAVRWRGERRGEWLEVGVWWRGLSNSVVENEATYDGFYVSPAAFCGCAQVRGGRVGSNPRRVREA